MIAPHVVALFLCSGRSLLAPCHICTSLITTRARHTHAACFAHFNHFQSDIGQCTEFIPYSPPTMLENLSRTVRNYVPTSIPVPVTGPPPPVSMPVSFGNLRGVDVGRSSPHSSERESLTGTPSSDRRRARQSSSQPFSRARGSLAGSPEVHTTVLGSEEGDVTRGNHLLTAYPTVAKEDNVLWSRWDSLPQPNMKPR